MVQRFSGISQRESYQAGQNQRFRLRETTANRISQTIKISVFDYVTLDAKGSANLAGFPEGLVDHAYSIH